MRSAGLFLFSAASFATAANAQTTPVQLSYGTNYYYYSNGLEASQSAQNAPVSFNQDAGQLTTPSGLVPGSSASGTATAGLLRTTSRIGAYQTNIPSNQGFQDYRVISRVGFGDSVILNTGTPGERGVATFTYSVDGVLTNRLNNAYSDYARYELSDYGIVRTPYGINQCSPNSGYCELAASVGAGQLLDTSISRTFTYVLNYISGQPTSISIELESDIFARVYSPGYVYVLGDFGHTLTWGGLVSATGTNGSDVTSRLAIQSGSGFNYREAAISAVSGAPEPGAWAMMIVGLGLAGAALRRPHRRLVATA